MSKSGGIWNSVAVWVVSIFLGFVALALTQSIFMLFFVPVVVGVLWSTTQKIGRLERSLSELEARLRVERSGTGEGPP